MKFIYLLKKVLFYALLLQVVQKKDNLIQLKVRPFLQLILPNELKRIEILNDSGKVSEKQNFLFFSEQKKIRA